MELGFSRQACIDALQKANSNRDRAVELLLGESAEVIPVVVEKTVDPKYAANITHLAAMGFDEELASAALEQSGNSIETALDLLINGKVNMKPM